MLMRILLLDGYIDEPACLGVPPYVSPHVRYIYGSILDAGAEVNYARIEDWRWGLDLTSFDALVLFGGTTVPGKYLRGYPMSSGEARRICDGFSGTAVLTGPLARAVGQFTHFVSKEDGDAFVHDLISTGKANDRRRTQEERWRWSVIGSALLKDIAEGPQRCVMEVELFRGCPRYITGGCSFCSEPTFGIPEFRSIPEVVDEVGALHDAGGVNIRLGGQSCIFSYLAEGVGRAEIVKPRPEIHETLFSQIRKRAPNLRVLHVDNANPSVMVSYPQETMEILRTLVKYTTDGNVLAMGLESCDPVVQRMNNLNTNAQETLEAVRMVNSVGSQRGPSGLPMILPGINLVMGLPGETASTYEHNTEFFKNIIEEGLLLRRINIRQVMDSGRGVVPNIDKRRFRKFKEWVRSEVDNQLLKRILPKYCVLKNAMVEKVDGKWCYLRQLGSYPLLIAVPYPLDIWSFHDVSVIDWGQRSVTAIEYPFHINSAHVSVMATLPGIGKKRAATLFNARPFECYDDLLSSLDDFEPEPGWEKLFSFENLEG